MGLVWFLHQDSYKIVWISGIRLFFIASGMPHTCTQAHMPHTHLDQTVDPFPFPAFLQDATKRSAALGQEDKSLVSHPWRATCECVFFLHRFNTRAQATSSSNCILASWCAFSLWNVVRTLVHSCLSNEYVRGALATIEETVDGIKFATSVHACKSYAYWLLLSPSL